MTATVVVPPSIDALLGAARAAGLSIQAVASWPETSDDHEIPPLAGFVESSFSPLAAAVAARVLSRCALAESVAGTAVVLVTALGDVPSAVHVAQAVDAGQRVRPLLFFQSVPNAIAGYIAARHRLTGPIVCLTCHDAGVATAALLLDDGDADAALLIWLDVAGSDDQPDRVAAVVLTAHREATA
jgi:3-oxoacyl-(acyl-carrier-protein) synthase